MEARFSTPVQTGPGAHLASCTMGTGSFPGGKERPGLDADPSPLSSAVGHERVELNLYSPYGPYDLNRASVPVQGCTLPSSGSSSRSSSSSSSSNDNETVVTITTTEARLSVFGKYALNSLFFLLSVMALWSKVALFQRYRPPLFLYPSDGATLDFPGISFQWEKDIYVSS